MRGNALEALEVAGERDAQGCRALFVNLAGTIEMNRLGRHEANTAVAVFDVVPGKEALAVGTCLPDRTKALGEIESILQGSELGFGVRVVVGNVGVALGLGDPEIDQQFGLGLGAHAGAAIGVERESAGSDVLLGNRLDDQLLGPLGALARGDQPADHEMAEDVRDRLQVNTGPLSRAFELRASRPGGRERAAESLVARADLHCQVQWQRLGRQHETASAADLIPCLQAQTAHQTCLRLFDASGSAPWRDYGTGSRMEDAAMPGENQPGGRSPRRYG